MSRKIHTGSEKMFIEQVKELEERLFAGELDPDDTSRMKSDRYSWHYRPSHHIASGLLTKNDIDMLSQPGRLLLCIGAHPAKLEQLLCTIGVPPENILVADKDPAIMQCAGPMQKIVFDANQPWPDIGTFDLIIFPESLCMCTGHMHREKGDVEKGFPGDAKEALLLGNILMQALDRLRPDGIICANGPMSHPNVVKAAKEILQKRGYQPGIKYQRFLITVQR